MRSDVQEVNNPSLAIALKQNRRPGVPLRAEAAMTAKDPPSKVETRINLIEPKDRDPNGLERVFGTSDLLSINFLARGMQAAAAVARLRVRLPDGSGEWFGTGFLVAPGLLMTNNHVLPNAASTRASRLPNSITSTTSMGLKRRTDLQPDAIHLVFHQFRL